MENFWRSSESHPRIQRFDREHVLKRSEQKTNNLVNQGTSMVQRYFYYLGEIPTVLEIKEEMSQRFDLIYNIYNEKIRGKH